MTWMQTYNGTKFSFVDPQPEDINIEDIFQHLGKMCRFTGAVKTFYSVAQHCILVSEISEDSYEGLMHDAAEAYYGDLNIAFKMFLEEITGKSWKEMVGYIDFVVAQTLGYRYPTPKEIKIADRIMLATERRDLLFPSAFEWAVELPEPDLRPIYPAGPRESVILFRTAYHEVAP